MTIHAPPASTPGDDQQQPASWSRGAGRRFAGLALSRVVVQLLRLVWFVLAVRLLPETALGEVATGLVFFAIFAGIGDLGTTKTVVRLVSADPDLLWPIVRAAIWRRVGGGLAAGVVVVAGLALAGAAVRPVVVALAALAAAASGCTEISFAALRTLAQSKTEQAILILERIGFIAVGVVLIELGGRSLAVLLLYFVANMISGGVTTTVVFRQRSKASLDKPVPSLWDQEARRTALGFALFTVTPRIGPAVLALLVAPAVVAEFSVAYRPVEGIALFALAAGVPLLPILRTHVLAGRQKAVDQGTAAVVAVLGAALAPFVAIFLGWPSLVVWMLTGSTTYGAANQTLAALGLLVFTWNFRGVGESLLYAQERASSVIKMTVIGLIITLVLAVPAIDQWGSPGAAGAMLIGEAFMIVHLVSTAPELRTTAVRVTVLRLLLMVSLASVILTSTSSTPIRITTLVIMTALATVQGLAGLRQLDAASKEETNA